MSKLPNFPNFTRSKLQSLEINGKKVWKMPNFLKFGSLEFPKFGSLEVWKFGHFQSLEVWKFETLKVWKCKSLEFPKFGSLEVWKFGSLGFTQSGSSKLPKFQTLPSKCKVFVGKVWKFGCLKVQSSKLPKFQTSKLPKFESSKHPNFQSSKLWKCPKFQTFQTLRVPNSKV